MSGLAALLAGELAPGTYRFRDAAPVVGVRDRVERAGWHFAHHDGRAETTRAQVLAGLGTALDLPAHYGQNLDALVDCLRDVGSAGEAGTVLLWDGWGTFARADRWSFARVLRVLAARAGAAQRAPFAVLLRDDGPAPEIPGSPGDPVELV